MQRQSFRLGLGVAALTTAFLGAKPASAQAFYEAGKISIAVERVFGIHHHSWEVEPDEGPSFDGSSTHIGFGWYRPGTPTAHPRVALDGFIKDQLSLGGSIAFFTVSGDADGSGFLLHPRVGYAIPISRLFTFWPRGGLTYWDVGDASLLALTAEAMFVLSPRPNWHVLFGPAIDFGLTGDEPRGDYGEFSLGFPYVGLMATF